MIQIESILKDKGISPTPVRKLVYKSLLEAEHPVSLSDLEVLLDSVDKSSISRTLSLFRDNHMVHSFSDGSGSMKYEVCHSPEHQEGSDMHVHFHCEKCGATICFNELRIPQVVLPEGFTVHETSYLISGVCDNCKE